MWHMNPFSWLESEILFLEGVLSLTPQTNVSHTALKRDLILVWVYYRPWRYM